MKIEDVEKASRLKYHINSMEAMIKELKTSRFESLSSAMFKAPQEVKDDINNVFHKWLNKYKQELEAL